MSRVTVGGIHAKPAGDKGRQKRLRKLPHFSDVFSHPQPRRSDLHKNIERGLVYHRQPVRVGNVSVWICTFQLEIEGWEVMLACEWWQLSGLISVSDLSMQKGRPTHCGLEQSLPAQRTVGEFSFIF